MLKKTTELLRGTLCVRVETPFPERVLNICAANGIDFRDLRYEGDTALRFTVRRADAKKLRAAVARLDATLTVERRVGAPYFLRRFRRRYALVGGLALLAALFIVNSFFIWDFTVTGNDTVPTEKILRVLEAQGIRRGTFAYSFRPQDICNRALPELPELAWLTVNVRGCRANVAVVERVPKPELADDRQPTNVVAKKDALVTRVLALGGKAHVMKDTTVRAGELLISGAIETEGTTNPSVPHRLVVGHGEVWGRTWYTLTTQIPLVYEEKIATERESTQFALLIGINRVKFGTKGSSILQGNCDKIICQTKLSLPGGFALPLTWEKTTLRSYETRTAERSAEEAERRGAQILMDYLETQIDGEVTSTELSSVQRGDVLVVTLRTECLEQIGEVVPIAVS